MMNSNARICYLHIGMHKTGTSSIQDTLFAVGDAEHIYYANISGIANHGGPLINIFSKTAATHHANIKRGLTAAEIAGRRNLYLADLLSTMRAHPDKNMVISGEGITTLEEDELVALRQVLAEVFSDIRVIGYVRSPKSYMESAFQQSVKGFSAQLNLQALYPEYRLRFEKFDRVFGRDRVLLRKFVPAEFPGQCVVTDFCRIIGWPIASEQIVRTNESMSFTAVSMLFAYRKYGPGYGVGHGVMYENSRLVEKLATLTGPKLHFSDHLVADVLQSKYADVRWMEARLAATLDDRAGTGEGGIDSEDALLQIDPASVAALIQLIDPEKRPPGVSGNSPQEVAHLVHSLRLQLNVRRSAVEPSKTILNIGTLFAVGKGAHPQATDEISAKQAAALLQEVFRRIGRELDGVETGMVRIGGLGCFRIRRVQKNGAGGGTQRRVTDFSPAAKRGNEKAV